MRPWRIAALSIVFGIAGALAILMPVFLVSWQLAVADQRANLQHSAVRVLGRADAIYAEAKGALTTIASTELSPCSPEHIVAMRQLTLASLDVNNIGYSSDGLLRCTAYGPATRVVRTNQADVERPDGISIHLNWESGTPGRGPVLIIRKGNYGVLIDQRRFYDRAESPSARNRLTVFAANGVALQPALDRTEPPQVLDGQTVVEEVQKSDDWIVSLTAPRIAFADVVVPVQETLLPLAAGLALLCGGAAAWVLTRRMSPRSEILAGLRNREFVIHYQPIIALATRRCVGGEALIRWRRPDGTLLRPDLFIPVAEETAAISAITDRVVEDVIREAGNMLVRNPEMHIAINIPVTDINSGRILEMLDRTLARTDIAPDQIWLEATERGIIDPERARVTLASLRRRGFRVAIDDFGTGYSSLQYLQNLPVDMLKIDKSFIDTIGTGAPTSQVTSHIIAMARSLNLTLVAEGVETESQAAFLSARNVEYAQGWLFSAALPIDEFLSFLERNNNDRRTAAPPA